MVEQNYEKRLEKFYSGLNDKLQIYRKEKQSWDRFLSTDFNDFNVVSEFIRPKENRLSDIIACLLDANGSHGQGSKFLDAFLKRLFKENQPNRIAELSGKQPQVKREDPTHYNENQSRRIDITVDFEGFGIGIENKPWAGEQEYQLRDYYSHLKDKYENEEFCLVFITPNGTHPTTICKPEDFIQKGELYCLSYRSDILEWIEECWQLCENDKFRWFLCDFREYIRAAFLSNNNEESKDDLEESKRDIILEHALKNDILKIVLDIVSVGSELEIRPKPFQMEISERDIMLNHILENEKNLEIARDIISADSALHERIVKTFLKKLEDFIKEKLDMPQWSFEEKDDPFQQKLRTIFLLSKKAWQERYGIGLRGRYGAVFVAIGVHKAGETTPSIEDLKSELDEKFEIGTSDPSWVWLPEDYLSNWEYKNWKDPDNLIKMHNGEAVKDVGDRFFEIVRVAEPVIDKWIEENHQKGDQRWWNRTTRSV